MVAGRIVDVGRHDELLGRCAAYQQLYQTQFAPTANPIRPQATTDPQMSPIPAE
jgi:hypothetical protein